MLYFSPHFNHSNDEEHIPNAINIGVKSVGIFNSKVVSQIPPFIVIDSSLYQQWLYSKAEFLIQISQLAIKIIGEFKRLNINKIVLRSSSSKEGLDQRGFYESNVEGVDVELVEKYIDNIYQLNKQYISLIDDNRFSVIIQQFIKPEYYGHMSNERRITKDNKKWFVEILKDNNFINSKLINSKNRPHNTDTSQGIKNIYNELYKVALKLDGDSRYHIEWIWNGIELDIVQCDFETPKLSEFYPGDQWEFGEGVNVGAEEFSVLKEFSNSLNRWHKIDCVKTFYELGLPYGQVYIIEGKTILKEIIKKRKINKELSKDIKKLLTFPLVIRMDINREDNQLSYLLPRTETLSTFEEAENFIVHNAEKYYNQLKNYNFCFLIHRFIVSKACALAYSKPNIPRVRIDSNWGIVDGLYYHPHDSFEVNTADKTTKRKLRCKTEFLDFDKTGKWISRQSGESLDWKQSLTSKELNDIAAYSTKISLRLGKPVVIMYFVGIAKNSGYKSIIPWYYTTEEVAITAEKFNQVIFSEKKTTISTEQNFNDFIKQYSEEKITHKPCLKLKLSPDILRDREFIDKIGDYCFKNDIPVELEGSILAHAYYILHDKGVKVKCPEPFDPKYGKQFFYKLVRDNIPVQIDSGGEKSLVRSIESLELLKFLKRKAIEEAIELNIESEEDKIIGELADLFEIIRAIIKMFNINFEEIQDIADKKKESRGAFDSGQILIETTQESLIEFKKPKETKKTKKKYRISSSYDIRAYEDSILLPYMPARKYNLDQEIKLDDITLSIRYLKEYINIHIKRTKDKRNPQQLSLFSEE